MNYLTTNNYPSDIFFIKKKYILGRTNSRDPRTQDSKATSSQSGITRKRDPRLKTLSLKERDPALLLTIYLNITF